MPDNATLWNIERSLWLGGVDAYREWMSDGCIMVFPRPVGIMDRGAILEAVAGAPRWDDVEFDETREMATDNETVTLAYTGRGQRGTDMYEALCSSTYRRLNGNWRIIQHQQTPVGG
ncbi:nuclear transport factor 2 family protein [Henriciella pelagia]|jgi:hypothetical protein|uniref:DUF4440 domain-containing protein n=1 Tax=Henriciella pelagia TaxID=1977912 RepID=A0ABQ1J1Z7_9PROT|nr:nuclear transport factor 2 family protein [Henriciella pelagia]GGB56882.1 hypothetical protein GCM10011503_01530 [Henriciella pelagia]